MPRSRAVESHWAADKARTEPGHSRCSAGLLLVACCGTTASRPSNVPGQGSPGPGTSRSERRGVRAEPAANLRGCQTPHHRSVRFPKPGRCGWTVDDQQPPNPGESTVKLSTFQAPIPTTCCSFEMIRASFATRVGKWGVFTLYMDRRGPRSQRVSARTTDQREIRCERQTVAAAHQPPHRRRSRPGSGQVRHSSCAESDLAQNVWQGRLGRPVRGPSICNSRAASISSGGCATGQQTAARP